MRSDAKDSVNDASATALAALGWVLANDDRAQRFLDLTGLTPDGLRDALGDLSTHRAILDFLAAHEPDLLGAAEALGLAPEQLVAARQELSE
ncbi:DUF3572 domain-containing protein [Aurantiacibacter sp. MUD11]|nr:DUF3572 domain-containing protein [Aurantiacibacter sp. MUD11]WAT19352.1 DUF3572 domain-containing protein [Aurantiacibacter sp. MUD11]